MHTVGEPTGLSIKINYNLAMAKTKQIQSLFEQSNTSHLSIQDQINPEFSNWY